MKGKKLLTCFLMVGLILGILFTPTQSVLAKEEFLLSNDVYYCTCGRTRFPIYDIGNTYFVAINDSQHQQMTPFVVACPCGATPIRGVKPEGIYNHQLSFIDLGHSPIHPYQKYCSTCNYSGAQIKVSCSGPPCIAPYNN